MQLLIVLGFKVNWNCWASLNETFTRLAGFRIPVDRAAGWAAWTPWPHRRCPSAARCLKGIERWKRWESTWSGAWRIAGTCCCPSTFCSRSCPAWARGRWWARCRRLSGWRSWSWSRGRRPWCCKGSWMDLWTKKCKSWLKFWDWWYFW